MQFNTWFGHTEKTDGVVINTRLLFFSDLFFGNRLADIRL